MWTFSTTTTTFSQTEAEFNAYRSKMPWLNLDFSERDLKGTLGQVVFFCFVFFVGD